MPQFGLARTQPTAVPDTQTDTDIAWYFGIALALYISTLVVTVLSLFKIIKWHKQKTEKKPILLNLD